MRWKMERQRTDAWFNDRLGKVTASNVHKVMSKGEKRTTYLYELLSERIEGKQDSFCSEYMQRGTDLEPEAKAAYSIETGIFIDEIGFVPHPTIINFGASPDGLIESDGLIEIKCPKLNTHLKTISTDKIKPEYLYQMYTQMSCTGRVWCDFVSYYPNINNNLFIKRIIRDDEKIAEIEKAVILFLEELDELERKINEPNNSNR